MSSGTASRVIALLLVVGLVAGLGATYLAQAGVPGWIIAIAVLGVLVIPIVAARRGQDSS